jgi:mRNA-degrading endonuclease RelE of RelBE toxin-antitoxin system
MTYNVFVTYEIKEFFRYLDSKTSRIIKQNLKKLEQNPYPGKGTGDKERLPIQGKQRYRMHIGRTWTVFYSIIEKKKQVRISEIIPIDDAHKKYGF